MRLDESARGDHSVLTLGGDVTAGEAVERLAAALARAEADRPGAIVLDVTEVRHLDSTALGAIVGCLRRVHGAGREMRLVGVGHRLQLLLQLTNLAAMFPTHATVPDALAAEHARSADPAATSNTDKMGGELLGDRDRRDV